LALVVQKVKKAIKVPLVNVQLAEPAEQALLKNKPTAQINRVHQNRFILRANF
jgi:hypothetical protein